MAIYVSRKDGSEANENIIRRFNRRVLQGGLIPAVKETMRFHKPLSKRERRIQAIIRDQRRAEKNEQIKLGLR
jgi:ribosomal protein S21